MYKLSITILTTLFLIACGAESEKPVEPEQKADSVTPDRAAEIHARAIVIDAHADIEIPGSPSPYVGDDGRSQPAPAGTRHVAGDSAARCRRVRRRVVPRAPR